MSLEPLTSAVPPTLNCPSTSSILEDTCSKYLGTGEGKVFDDLISLKAQATYLTKREPGRPNILYDKYYTTLSYRGRNLVLSGLQSGLDSLISSTWERLLALSGGTKIPVDVPVGMSEDVRSSEMGESFINHLATTPETLPLLREMSRLPGFNLFKPAEEGSGRSFDVDPSVVDEFLYSMKPVVEAIVFLIHVTGSGPCRMSEVVEDRYRNGSKIRNLLISHGRVFILRTDIKTTPIRGKRSAIFHYPAPKVIDLLVYYLSVVRPLETFLAGHLGRSEQYAAYYQFIYVIRGSVLTPRAFSDIIAGHTERYFGCRLTGLDFRHVMISIQAIFLPPFLDPLAQKFGDSQAGHGTVVRDLVYSQRFDDLSGKEVSASSLAITYCESLHKVLGVGAGPPTPPIPHLYTQGEQPWLDLPHQTPSATSLEGQLNGFHARVATTLVTVTNDIMRGSEKAMRDSVFEAVAALGTFPFPGGTPSKQGLITVPDRFEVQPSSVSLRVGKTLIHSVLT